MTMSMTNYDNQQQQQQQHYDDDFPRWYRELFVSCFPSSDKEKEEGLLFLLHCYYNDPMMDFLQPISGDNNNNNNNNKKEWQDFPWQWLLLQQEISQRLTQTQSTTTMPSTVSSIHATIQNVMIPAVLYPVTADMKIDP